MGISIPVRQRFSNTELFVNNGQNFEIQHSRDVESVTPLKLFLPNAIGGSGEPTQPICLGGYRPTRVLNIVTYIEGHLIGTLRNGPFFGAVATTPT